MNNACRCRLASVQELVHRTVQQHYLQHNLTFYYKLGSLLCTAFARSLLLSCFTTGVAIISGALQQGLFMSPCALSILLFLGFCTSFVRSICSPHWCQKNGHCEGIGGKLTPRNQYLSFMTDFLFAVVYLNEFIISMIVRYCFLRMWYRLYFLW